MQSTVSASSGYSIVSCTSEQVRLALEDLLYEQGVDLQIWAHEHEYERMYPMYNYMICNGSKEAPYTNPRAPVHIVTGSAVSIFIFFLSNYTITV